MRKTLSAPLDEFKERELEILNLIALGMSNQEIADELFITKETVRWYNKQIYSKLGTSRRTEAIAIAREFNLIGNRGVDSSPNTQQRLPITTGPFIGRGDELVELEHLLKSPDVRLLSIIAAGGMGKSRLSLELGHRVKDNYEHGVVFIDLTPVRHVDDIPKITVASLGLSVSPDTTWFDTIINYCREKELLLIFDNFEHVLSGANLTADILETAPKVSIIATSRERLNLRVETAFYLQPIMEQGNQLFLEVAEMMHPHVNLTEGEQKEVDPIVTLVGGSPLALTIAATWLDTLSVSEIAEEIKTDLDFLSAEMGDMPERQRSIHAVIDPTWKRLTESEKQAFMWASVFRGGFTHETFKQVTSASARTLQTLLNRSLVHHGYGRRYEIHPLLRQYAREKLERSGALADAKKAHLTIFLAYAQTQTDRMYDGHHYLEVLEALDVEHDNFLAALDWSFDGYDTANGITLTLILCKFWSIRSQSQLAIHYIERAMKYDRNATLVYSLGYFEERLGHIDAAIAHFEEAVSLEQETQTKEIRARCYVRLARYNPDVSENRLQFLRQALDIAKGQNSPSLIASCHNSLGIFYSALRDKDTALEHYYKALTISENLGDLLGISSLTYNIAIETDDPKRKRKLIEDSLELKLQIGDRAGAARRLAVLARFSIQEEEYDIAQEYLAQSRLLCEETGERLRLVETHTLMSLLHIRRLEFVEAHSILQIGLRNSHAVKSYRYIETTNGLLALLHLIQRQPDQAKPYILNALKAHANVSHVWFSLVAYVNYLWSINKIHKCVSISAVTFHHISEDDVFYQFFLRPLYYKIQQEIGEEAWQNALNVAQGVSIEQIYQEVVKDLKVNNRW